MFWHCLCFSHFLTMTMSLLSNLPSMLQFHIMDSHGLCNWYSQPMLRVLHNAYSSQRWPMLRFFLIWYVGWRSARLVICGAWNGPSGCLWYDEWPTKFHKENVISLETCDIQLSNSMYYILVTSVYEPKQPFCWPLEHPMDHLAVCKMMSDPPSLIMRMLDH